MKKFSVRGVENKSRGFDFTAAFYGPRPHITKEDILPTLIRAENEPLEMWAFWGRRFSKIKFR